MSRTAEQAYGELIERVKEYHTLVSCRHVLDWERETYMPDKGNAHRAEQITLLAKLGHGMLTSPQIGELLSEVEGSALVSSPEADAAVNVREIRRNYDRATKLPDKLVQELARATTEASQIWRDARNNDDFEAFRPSLETIVRLKREEAQAIGYTDSPYDPLLDEYEPGATTAEITQVFADLRNDLVPLILAITNSGKAPRRDILRRKFPVDLQAFFGKAAGAAIGFDFTAGRLDVTTHPFCQSIGPGDCRLTTRYAEQELNQSYFGILHEAGHGMYEQGLLPEHFGTPLGTSVSLGIHESQSRLWENQVGRSRAFWEHFYPRAQQVFIDILADVSLDDFYFAVNDVQSSFIRVEADEATYNLHILLRFEIEQALMRDDLQPKDVPTAWNEKFTQYFGISPPNNRLGCLQDIHWSMGGIGYFPTYTLGNLYSAQFMEQAKSDLGDLEDDFRRGKFDRLKGWLNENIHQQGMRYRPRQFCEKVTGKPLTHQPLLRYMKEKYGPLYGV